MKISYLAVWRHVRSILVPAALFWILVCLSGCSAGRLGAGGGAVGDMSDGTVRERMEGGRSGLQAGIELARSGENTILSLPVSENTDVSPRVFDDELQLSFSPPLEGVNIPGTGLRLVSSMAKDPSSVGASGVSKLNIRLNGPFQFMFSKPSPKSLRVYFFPGKKTGSDSIAETSRSFSAGPGGSPIQDIRFTRNDQGHMLVRVATGPGVAPTPLTDKNDRIRIFFPNTSVPAWYAKLYNLGKFSTEVRSALLKNVDNGAELLFSVRKRIPMQMDKTPGGVLITLLTTPSAAYGVDFEASPEMSSVKSTSEQARDEADSDLQELNTLFPGMRTDYTGSPVSLDFQDADVEHVLRLLAEIGDYNLILDDGVGGNISLKLKNIPWDQALDLVLVQKGLGMVLKGNIMRIATAGKLEEERKQITRARQAALEAKESFENLAPLETAYIQINYSTAAELEPKVKEFLSPRGKVSPDSRTNILIVSDTKAQLKKIRRVLEKLDRAERQVRIEARIVYATDEFKRSLGLKWGGAYSTQESLAGEQWGWEDPLTVTGLNLPTQATNFMVGGEFSKLLGKDLFSLDMELQLGETTGISKTISAPKVVTLNNKEAEIEQTTQIAYNTLDDAGNTITEFKEAPLKLRVTPQITPDNKLLFDIEVNDDTATTLASSEEPAIESKRIQSKLIVDDKETIVIGGIQRVTRTTSQNRIPGAADVPVVGWLFKNQANDVSKQELLVFIRCEVL